MRRGLWFGLLIIPAALVQMVWANSMAIYGARPNFIILLISLEAMFCSANGGSILGFSGGLIYAIIAAPSNSGFGSLVVSGSVVGFCIGWLDNRIFRDNILLAMSLAGAGSLLFEVLFFLLAPQPHLNRWITHVWLTPIYNSILAIPMFFLIRRVYGSGVKI